MALWGTADAVYATGTIAVDLANKTITGTNSTFTSAAAGDVISVGVGNTFGEALSPFLLFVHYRAPMIL